MSSISFCPSMSCRSCWAYARSYDAGNLRENGISVCMVFNHMIGQGLFSMENKQTFARCAAYATDSAHRNEK